MNIKTKIEFDEKDLILILSMKYGLNPATASLRINHPTTGSPDPRENGAATTFVFEGVSRKSVGSAR